MGILLKAFMPWFGGAPNLRLQPTRSVPVASLPPLRVQLNFFAICLTPCRTGGEKVSISVASEHLLISIVPWLIGIVTGGGLGYGIGLAARRSFCTHPGLRRAAILLPWRTVAVTLGLAALMSPFTVERLGLGVAAGQVNVGLVVFVFALPSTVSTLLEYWSPSALVVRLINKARTLAVVSVAVAVMAHLSGSGGAGALIWQGLRDLDDAQLFRGFSVVGVLALIVDVLLGTLQLIFPHTVKPTSKGGR